jgi:subtilisin
MVAGYAAAIDNSIGVVGVAPGARVWAIRAANPMG